MVFTFTPESRATLESWLAVAGELYVDYYPRHSGGSGWPIYIDSIAGLEEYISRQDWHGIHLTIFRHDPYSLRGIANAGLLDKALVLIAEGKWYSMIYLGYKPFEALPKCGGGNSHEELRREIAELEGQSIGIGRNPFDEGDPWRESNPEEYLVFSLKLVGNEYQIIKVFD